jgi:putative phosphoribosyl transferase
MGEISMFDDRTQAGRQLAAELRDFITQNPAVYALPRGGVPVAAEVARVLRAPLDLIVVRKVGVPFQPELALGAVVDGEQPVVVLNDEVVEMAGVSPDEVEHLVDEQRREIARRRQLYLRGRPHVSASGRTAIIVDDGIATGATARAAIRALRKENPARIVLATPVAAHDILASLQADADDVRCLETPGWFPGVGAFYVDFHQVSDREVISILDQFPNETEGGSSQSA